MNGGRMLLDICQEFCMLYRFMKSETKTSCISGPRVIAQVAYHASTAARTTAAQILACKLRNCAAILKKHYTYQQRYEERASVMRRSTNRIVQLQHVLKTSHVLHAHKLFLMEAHAARAYWRAVRVLVGKHDPDWSRNYPHAGDPINILLNIGYRSLARWIRDAICTAGLLPQIGILHRMAEGKEPLVYDLVELFRQPVVDAVAIPFFTKKKVPVIYLSKRDTGRFAARLEAQWNRPVRYLGICVPLKHIAYHEVIALAHAMVAQKPWEPYLHPWGHGWSCAAYRPRSLSMKKATQEEPLCKKS